VGVQCEATLHGARRVEVQKQKNNEVQKQKQKQKHNARRVEVFCFVFVYPEEVEYGRSWSGGSPTQPSLDPASLLLK
jgi:hypothetical protein